MNCKPGDLAVIVRGAQSSGRIVRCIRILSFGESVQSRCGKRLGIRVESGNMWLIEGHALLRASDGQIYWTPAVEDSCLRPIRDPGEDAVDESLLWVRIPEVGTV